ncbi:Minus agglutinin [Actinosynnema pretiosum subsp. pretiosum]|nr:Minus agglutinin [Actinosynnema pretiosum subsp. pretiosum]
MAAVEHHLAAHAPAVPAAVLALPETRRVRELRAEVAEAHALVDLQDDPAPLLVDTDRVRRARKRAAEAGRLHALAQNPAALALLASRVRLVLTVVAVAALLGALAWSTTGTHATLTRDVPAYSAAWWGAWAVEPVISAVLLVVVAAKAFLATRGRVLHHRHLSVVEYGALTVTLTLNIWPYLPWLSLPWAAFDPMQLLAHAVGPLVAVGAVAVLPPVWTAFAELDHGLPVGPDSRPTSPVYRQNTPAAVSARDRAAEARTALLVERARLLIDAGQLPAVPSATRLRAALECGTDAARQVRDALRGGAN